jgi:hypothetical protein
MLDDDWSLPELPDGSLVLHPDDYEQLCREALVGAAVQEAAQQLNLNDREDLAHALDVWANGVESMWGGDLARFLRGIKAALRKDGRCHEEKTDHVHADGDGCA